MTATQQRTNPEATADASTDGSVTEVDVFIVGAGISGIGAAYHLQQHYPEKSIVLMEALDGPGGTWRTHRYPGARSDSDLFTFGYKFKPWRGPSIATAGEIRAYLDEVIDENNLAPLIRYKHRVHSAQWSSADERWTLTVTDADGTESVYRTPFLWMCQGYYNQGKPFTPTWPGQDDFGGVMVHPQTWPEDLDFAGKRVVVIGSGATAATLIPAMAPTAEHVTMLQRTPTYFLPRPKTLELAETLRSLDIPHEWTHEIVRRAYFQQGEEFTRSAKDYPEQTREVLLDGVREHLPETFDIDKHFNPPYRPWQQRIAVIPDADLFTTLAAGDASIVTDTIEKFTPTGIRTSSGEELDADIVVTATGFDLELFGNISFSIDGAPVDFTQEVTHRGIMITNVPNMVYVFGYFRASWTLRADLVSEYVMRLFEHMKEKDATVVVPRLRPEDADMPRRPFMEPDNVNSGYMMRSQSKMFGQGDREPWRHMKDFHEERFTLGTADLDDGLTYS